MSSSCCSAATSLTYGLTLEDPKRFSLSRTVAACLGLRPWQSQSGQRDPKLRITKAGARNCRRLLVQSAQYILGPFGQDADLRRFGLALDARGLVGVMFGWLGSGGPNRSLSSIESGSWIAASSWLTTPARQRCWATSSACRPMAVRWLVQRLPWISVGRQSAGPSMPCSQERSR